MINDLISDMINRVKTSFELKLDYVFVIYSKIIFFILKILKNEGYILDFYFFLNKNKKFFLIYLKYLNNKSVIQIFKRISKPSLRIYKGYKNLPKIMNGLGILIISSNIGIITDKIARKFNTGGELICYVF